MIFPTSLDTASLGLTGGHCRWPTGAPAKSHGVRSDTKLQKFPGQIIKRGANSTFVSTFFVTLYSLMLSAIKLINMGKAYVSPKRRNDLRSIGLWHGFRQTSITEGENSRSCMI